MQQSFYGQPRRHRRSSWPGCTISTGDNTDIISSRGGSPEREVLVHISRYTYPYDVQPQEKVPTSPALSCCSSVGGCSTLIRNYVISQYGHSSILEQSDSIYTNVQSFPQLKEAQNVSWTLTSSFSDIDLNIIPEEGTKQH